ncbi:MAG: HD domain-containing protein [Actinomycetota bacterium]|nr:HD domain-containing protein [Actinomycetota bacterium]
MTTAALSFASEAHGGQAREADRAPYILHPLEVASMLDGHGFDDAVTAAAVLHDTIEDTEASSAQLRRRFGTRVADLVDALTEAGTHVPEDVRRTALRERVARVDGEAAAIFAADKLSKVRELRIRLTCDPGYGDERAAEAKLDHYWKSLEILESTIGAHPLVRQLRFELEMLRALPPRGAP